MDLATISFFYNKQFEAILEIHGGDNFAKVSPSISMFQ